MVGKVNRNYFAICPVDSHEAAIEVAEQIALVMELDFQLGKYSLLDSSPLDE